MGIIVSWLFPPWEWHGRALRSAIESSDKAMKYYTDLLARKHRRIGECRQVEPYPVISKSCTAMFELKVSKYYS